MYWALSVRVLTLGAGTAGDIAIEIAHAVRHASGLIGADGLRAHGHLNPSLVQPDASGDVIVLGFEASPSIASPPTRHLR